MRYFSTDEAMAATGVVIVIRVKVVQSQEKYLCRFKLPLGIKFV